MIPDNEECKHTRPALPCNSFMGCPPLSFSHHLETGNIKSIPSYIRYICTVQKMPELKSLTAHIIKISQCKGKFPGKKCNNDCESPKKPLMKWSEGEGEEADSAHACSLAQVPTEYSYVYAYTHQLGGNIQNTIHFTALLIRLILCLISPASLTPVEGKWKIT